MEKMKKKLGFGFMRLPMKGDEIDIAQTCGMVDEFLARGFNYFDVARGYLNSRAEATLRTCLTSRHPRELPADGQALRQFFQNRGGCASAVRFSVGGLRRGLF